MTKRKYRFGLEYKQRQQIHLAKNYRKQLNKYTKLALAGLININTAKQTLNKLGIN